MKRIHLKKYIRHFGLIMLVQSLFFGTLNVNHAFATTQKPDDAAKLDKLISKIQHVYDVPAFSAHFDQESTLKAMDITDTASGQVFFKRPGMMRWDYKTPDKQNIITDGTQLWIYRPEENQVMVGTAPDFFGQGKGASFLSDIKSLPKKFNISLSEETKDMYILKLIPLQKTLDLKEIYLHILKDNFHVKKIVTLNAYDDKTTILLSQIKFDPTLSDAMFRFEVPEGTDLLRIDQ